MMAKRKPELSRIDKIRALAEEIKAHQDRMLELIDEEASADKRSYPSLPLEVLKQQILNRGVCPCTAMLARLGEKERAEGNG